MDCEAVDAGFAAMLHDNAGAGQALDAAWKAAAGDDATRWLLSAAALLGHGADFADFRGLQSWVHRFAAGEQAAPALQRDIDRLRIDGARVQLPSLTHDVALDAPGAREAAARLFEALRAGLWPAGDEQLMLAKALYDYHGLNDDEQRCERVALLVAESAGRAPAPAHSPPWRLRWMLLLEYCLDYWGQPAAALELRRQARELVEAHSAPALAWGLAVSEMRVALRDNDSTAQDRLYATMDRLRLQVRPGLALRGLFWQATVLMRRMQHGAALDKLDLVLSLCDDVEVPLRDRGLYLEMRAYALAGLQRWDEAEAQLQQLAAHQTGGQAAMAQTIAMALRAARAWTQHDPHARALALQAIRMAAAQKWQRLLLNFPAWAAWLAQTGLDAEVETEFVSGMVRARRLVPPDRHRSAWPWRLRVRALGPLRLERDGLPLGTTGKAQRKPLELLALLTAQGGQPLSADTAMDELWPSLEAEAPRASLDMALSRLRKLLDLPDAVRWVDGHLVLDAQIVWTDVAAFEARCARAEAADAGGAGAEEARAAAAEAIALYEAPLLGAQTLGGLVLAQRQRLAQRHLHLVQRQAQAWLDAGQWQAAAQLIERVLPLHPHAEPLYRGLMAAQLQGGETALALQTYAACEAALQRMPGVAPSASTRALADLARQPR